MELNGALWNPLENSKNLRELLGKIRELILRERPPLARAALAPRIGEVKGAVVRVLELAEQPLSLGEIRGRCEDFLGRPVNDSTVKDCVHKLSRGSDPLFLRLARGRYVGRPLADATPEPSGRR